MSGDNERLGQDLPKILVGDQNPKDQARAGGVLQVRPKTLILGLVRLGY